MGVIFRDLHDFVNIRVGQCGVFQQRGGEMGRNSPTRLTVRNLSNGAWSESFQPADYTMRGIGEARRNEIIALFPELEDRSDGVGWPSARKVLKKHEAQLLTS